MATAFYEIRTGDFGPCDICDKPRRHALTITDGRRTALVCRECHNKWIDTNMDALTYDHIVLGGRP